MTEPGKQSSKGEHERDDLELDKQAIKDLDVNEQDADLVKGGNSAECMGTPIAKPPTI
jgi:hypothetical protein